MIEIVESVVIAAPLGKVWQTFTDLTCWADWNSVLTGVQGERNSCIVGEGSFRCCIRPYGVPVFFKAEIAEFEPLRRVVWTTARHGVKSRHEFLFEEEGGEARVLSREHLTGILVRLGGIYFLLPQFRKMTATFLEELKKGAEQGGEGR